MTCFSPTSPFQKPPGCAACPYNAVGTGFVPTWVGQDPKVAFLLEAPGQEEMYDREPLVGALGKLFFKRFIEPLGYTRANVILANTVACRPPDNSYPTGAMRGLAERHCRQYDGVQGPDLRVGGLDAWNADLYLISYHPAFILRSWSLLRVLATDIEKAFIFAEQGKRPLVLLGEIAMKLVKPSIQVGLGKYRGHFGDLDWSAFKGRWA